MWVIISILILMEFDSGTMLDIDCNNIDVHVAVHRFGPGCGGGLVATSPSLAAFAHCGH
jgi:hypothetical protein